MSTQDLRERWLATLAAAERALAVATATGLVVGDEAVRLARGIDEHRDFVLKTL